MKRPFICMLVCILLFASVPVSAADTAPAPPVHVKAGKTAYGDDVTRVTMHLINNSGNAVTLEPSFYMQVFEDGHWQNMLTSKGRFACQLDAAGIQLPSQPGTVTELGAYIGDYRISDGSDLGSLAPGYYRIVVRDTSGEEYPAPFEVSDGLIFADPAVYSMRTERPVYDASIDQIKVLITNSTDAEAGFDMAYRLERFDGTAWKSVPAMDGRAIAVPAIAAGLPAGRTVQETISMSPYAKPMAAGRYRILKSIDMERVCAEFTIPEPAACLQIKELEKASVTLLNRENKVSFSVGPEESPDTVTALWHELLAFQMGTKPASPSPFAEIVLSGRNNSALGAVNLYSSGGRTWAEFRGKWYYTVDTGMTERLQETASGLGASLPASGKELIQALNALPPLRNVKLSAHQFSTPFALPGWRTDRQESGVTLSVFQFSSAEAVNRQMRYLYENGYTLGMESRVGSGSSQAVSFEQKRFDWSDPPHYFKAGSRLVLYNGSDQAILSALAGLLGPEVKAVE